jgi:hypothetical protein
MSDDYNQIIDRCKQMYDEIKVSFESLHNIKELIDDTIYVTYNGENRDFSEVLEEFHKIALKNIKDTGVNNFGELIRSVL